MTIAKTVTSESNSPVSVVLAAQIREDAPGKGTVPPQAHRLTGVELADVIRANGPGRTTKN